MFQRSLPPVANDNLEPLAKRMRRLAPGLIAAAVAFVLVYIAFLT